MDLQLFSQEPTEEASPKRLREAREKGQFPRSQDLVAGLGLVGAAMVMRSMGPGFYEAVSTAMTTAFTGLSRTDMTPQSAGTLLQELGLLLLRAVLPLAGVLVLIGLVAGLLQSNFHLSLNHLAPDFKKINPASGLKRIFSLRTLVEVLKGLMKLAAIGLVAYRTFMSALPEIPSLMGQNVAMGVAHIGGVVVSSLQTIGFALLALGMVDYGYQFWEFRKSVRMTKQQVKEEMKQQEGAPEIKQRQRQQQRELARRRRALKDVSTADVVVTNPTHYAVAVKYDSAAGAPRVVAKGADLLAQRIKVLAKKHAVPMVENRLLARTLYASVAIGKAIPPELYTAVAEVLALVYSLRRQQRLEQRL